MKKKAISPVVASALLLVIAVISVIGFQNWYGIFQSTTLINIDNQNSKLSSFQIEAINSNNLYISSSSNSNISTLKISDLNGNEMCLFSKNDQINNSDLLIHYTNNISFNGTNYFLNDNTGNGYDALLLNEDRANSNYLFLATSGTNETHINFNYNYRVFNDDTLNGCFVKYNSQEVEILDDTLISTYSREIDLNSNLIGMTNGERFSIMCNQTDFYTLNNDALYFDGYDDFMFVENSESFVNSVLEYDNNFTITMKIKPELNPLISNQAFFYTRVGCGTEDKIGMRYDGSSMAYLINFSSGITFAEDNFFGKESILVYRNSYNGLTSTVTGFSNHNQVELTSSFSNFQSPNNLIVLGKSLGCNNYQFKGHFYDFKIFNRSLSDLEIQRVYFDVNSQINNGINSIDISSCNLEKKKVYEVLLIDKSKTLIKKVYYD